MGMKLPNGYGSVINLGKRRRRPYAVRITTGAVKHVDDDTGRITYRQQYRYLAYFEKSAPAYDYLSKINSGVIKAPAVTAKLVQPTFAEIFDKWMDFRESLLKKSSPQATASYNAAFKRMSKLHPLPFAGIRLDDLQQCINDSSDMSASTVNNMIVVLHGMYDYAMKYDLVSKDYSKYVVAQYRSKGENIHTPFTDEEIDLLWKYSDNDIAAATLIMIYTGMRVTELLQIQVANIHLDEHYMVGGIKTKAGKNRNIPIHDRILPLVERFMSRGSEYLYGDISGKPYTQKRFADSLFTPLMKNLGLKHLTHDCKHTCATKMEAAGIPLLHRKLILGHQVNADITEGIYTHVSVETLVADINKI